MKISIALKDLMKNLWVRSSSSLILGLFLLLGMVSCDSMEEQQGQTGKNPPTSETSDRISETDLFTEVDEMPVMLSCATIINAEEREACHLQTVMAYLKDCPYPEAAKENRLEGKVFVRFVINESGKVEQVEAVNESDPILTKTAIEYIEQMPEWQAGRQAGEAVKVQLVVPMNFSLS